MVIHLENPLYTIDIYIQHTFSELFNAMVYTTNPAEMHRQFLRLCARGGHRNPDNYFKWGFDGTSFWLQQRIDYRSDSCFHGRVLTVLHYSSSQHLPESN